ncbi:MAG: AbrB/MazE/SpoVT family DNA-binding domain-containing protein [Pleurocapsa sp.]
METTRLSSKGQVIIPKTLRDAHHWLAGQELIAINTGDGILLKPKKPFRETKLENVAGYLQYEGKAKTLEKMDDAISIGVLEQYGDRTIEQKS